MYKTRLGGCVDGANKAPQLRIIETDPSGRYGRFNEVLGKGAMKTVYRAFDEVVGMEVAWNQVTLTNLLRSPEELQRLYSEVHLLKNLNHDSIIKFYASWIDVDRRTFNFITEMFTSGTLREYRKKYQRVDIRAVKNWARQILRGLAYLHEHDPPVIHRDLKCDNIFVNGHLGQVKIGDLGLAAILRGSQHAHSVIGTPEFMAPELYEEEYDELVDIYSFGMCVLEMLTSEYPYSECSNPAQIYKKVTSGKLPEAFYKIKDFEAQKFVGKCLETASKRLPARELLLDPFLASNEMESIPIQKLPPFLRSTPDGELEDTLPSLLVDSSRTTDVTITGTMNPDDDTIFLKVQISDKDGHTRNIYFPFDINNDTAIDVAMEMVKELEITDLEPLEIAEMIEEEVTALLPTWKEWELPEVNNPLQYSFSYDVEGLEEDDDSIHHPLHSASSRSSSQASLLALISSSVPRGNHGAISLHNWLQGELLINDDASSQSSVNSFKYSTLNYCSGKEADDYENTVNDGNGDNEEEPLRLEKTTHVSSRFCPEDKLCGKCEQSQRRKLRNWEPNRGCGSSNPQGKLSRIRSMVDMRSQLLHKSLVEQINRRRMFKTVGAVENIGYRGPNLPPDNDGKLRFKW